MVATETHRSRQSTHGGRSIRARVFLVAVSLLASTTAAADDVGSEVTKWFSSQPPGDPVRHLDGTRTARKVRLDGTTRNAVMASDDLTWTSAIGPSDSLDLAMAVVCLPRPGHCWGTTVFEVLAEIPGQPTRTVLRAAIDRSEAAQWKELRADLSDLAGKTAVLRFTTTNTAEASKRTANAGVMLPLWGEPLVVRPEAKPAHPNVILISLDTLRADRLGCYGYDRNTSPQLDELASEGFRFDQAISQAPWTTPSHASIFTSLHPSSHKVAMPLRALDQGHVRFLAPEITTLAEILRANGMRTEAVTGGGTMSAVWGFDQGFDHYHEFARHYALDSLNKRGGESFADFWDSVVRRIDLDAGAPFFLFLHTFEIHAPYIHLELARSYLEPRQQKELSAIAAGGRSLKTGADFRRYLEKEGLLRAEVTSALYDGGVRFVDDLLIAPLVDKLREVGVYDRTVLVVTSDHGEEFGEHDPRQIYGAHGGNLYDTLIRVPLIIRAPFLGTSGRTIDDQVRSIDIAPTILDLLGIDVPPAMEGRSLVPLMRGEEAGPPPPAISEATSHGPEWKSLRSADYKLALIFDRAFDSDAPRIGLPGEPSRALLFDLASDPSERRNVATQQPDKEKELSAILGARVTECAATSTGSGGEARSLDEGVAERLRALGYLE